MLVDYLLHDEPSAQVSLHHTPDVRLNRDLSAIDQLVSRGELAALAATARKIARRASFLRYALKESNHRSLCRRLDGKFSASLRETLPPTLPETFAQAFAAEE